MDTLIVIAENPLAVLTPPNLTDTDPSNDHATLTITAITYGGEEVSFQLIGSADSTLSTGTFLSQDGNTMSLYYSSVNAALLADADRGTLTLDITHLENNTLEGNFTGILADTSGTILPRIVTAGFLRTTVRSN
jgi:hypothetical protein